MIISDIVYILENTSCYECSVGCRSPVECAADCDYKDANKKAIEILNLLDKEIESADRS